MNYRVKGNALQYTLVIGVILCILILTLMMYLHLNGMFRQRSGAAIDQMHLLEQSIIENESAARNDITLTSIPWGGYQLTTAASNSSSNNSLRDGMGAAALLNYKFLPTSYESTSLVIADSRSRFQVSGESVLKDRLQVPMGMITTASVGRRIYTGSKINLSLVAPSKELPVHPLEEFDWNYWDHFTEDINYLEVSGSDVKVSFYNTTQVISLNGNNNLMDGRFMGNLIINSNGSITIGRDTQISDALIIAKEITIKNGFSGNLNLVARDTVIIEDNVKLRFPSSITIPKSVGSKAYMEIGRDSEVYGNIFQFNASEERAAQSQIRVDASSTINGLFYNLGISELSGTYQGLALTNSTILKENGSVYLNYALDLKTGSIPWSRTYIGSYFEKQPNKTIGKWLY